MQEMVLKKIRHLHRQGPSIRAWMPFHRVTTTQHRNLKLSPFIRNNGGLV